MPTRVKICGITRAEDALLAIELGASALGFNFYGPSPRYVTPAAARAILRELPPLVMPVGVFADETESERVEAVAREAGVAAIQLHGPRFPSLRAAEALRAYPLIRAVAVGEGFRPEDLRGLQAGAFLLDTFDPALHGGTGRTFDWKVARQAKRFGSIILSGGLTPENVAQAIREVRPFAVDVASGVELEPGIKDAEKLRAFFAAVEKANRDVETMTPSGRGWE
jgi:phosphoribosylanthranilate isomerase